MFCPNCGNDVGDNYTCPYCNTSLDDEDNKLPESNKNIKIKVFVIIVSAVLIIGGIIGVTVAVNIGKSNVKSADSTDDGSKIVDSGSCGEKVEYTLDNSGSLVITGSGLMYNYDQSDNRTPWYENADSVKCV